MSARDAAEISAVVFLVTDPDNDEVYNNGASATPGEELEVLPLMFLFNGCTSFFDVDWIVEFVTSPEEATYFSLTDVMVEEFLTSERKKILEIPNEHT